MSQALRTRRGVLRKMLAALLGLVGLVLLSGAVVLTANWAAFGKRAEGERRAASAFPCVFRATARER
ncbi:MAG: hypothetical protein JRF55_06320 [Deltaproteobacteria bacterium]|nr:hypothetical protein [Deltaproteobacteria bacterium]